MVSRIFALFFVFAPIAAASNFQVVCSDPSNLTTVQPDYRNTMQEFLQQRFPGATVRCTSCYRSPVAQANACASICGERGRTHGCPGYCAPPGSSQHQKKPIATCDLSGPELARNKQETCNKLMQLCREKYRGLCGIGGYPGGSFHFGAGDSRFSSWNVCAGLRNNGNLPDESPEQLRERTQQAAINAQAIDRYIRENPNPQETQLNEEERRQIEQLKKDRDGDYIQRLMDWMNILRQGQALQQQQAPKQQQAPTQTAPAPAPTPQRGEIR